jgi:hypothetical protein
VRRQLAQLHLRNHPLGYDFDVGLHIGLDLDFDFSRASAVAAVSAQDPAVRAIRGRGGDPARRPRDPQL